MADLSPEAEKYLKEHTLCVFATGRKDGSPQQSLIGYQFDGKQFLLLSNSARGMMKISTENIEKQPALETKVADKAGLTYETIQGLENIEQLDKLGNANAIVLAKGTLWAIALP